MNAPASPLDGEGVRAPSLCPDLGDAALAGGDHIAASAGVLADHYAVDGDAAGDCSRGVLVLHREVHEVTAAEVVEGLGGRQGNLALAAAAAVGLHGGGAGTGPTRSRGFSLIQHGVAGGGWRPGLRPIEREHRGSEDGCTSQNDPQMREPCPLLRLLEGIGQRWLRDVVLLCHGSPCYFCRVYRGWRCGVTGTPVFQAGVPAFAYRATRPRDSVIVEVSRTARE